MSIRSSQRKLRELEAAAEQHLESCHDQALRALTAAEREQVCQLVQDHRARIDGIPYRAIETMPCPAWASPAAWAAMQRYVALFYAARQEYLEGIHHIG